MKKYLIIGNGTAGTTAAEHIRKHDPHGKITLATKEAFPLYSRIRLPEYLSNKIEESALFIKSREWHAQKSIDLITGVEIAKINFHGKQALSTTGETFEYDTLLLAPGSTSFIPPVKGADLEGVLALRNIEDVNKLKKRQSISKEIVLIGGGLLGLEAAAALVHSGAKVTVVEFFDRLLPRQLDYEGAGRLQALLEKMGFRFRLGEVTEEIIAARRKTDEHSLGIEGVRLKSGKIIPADTVLFSAGVRPDLVLTKNSDIKTDRGIVVDERMQTSIPSVYAAGDVAEFDGINFCIWPEATDQGRVAGINMAGGEAVYKNIPPSNMLKVAGITLACAGEIDVDGKMGCDIVSTDTVYKKTVKDSNGKTIGCIMLGDTTDFNKILKLIKGE